MNKVPCRSAQELTAATVDRCALGSADGQTAHGEPRRAQRDHCTSTEVAGDGRKVVHEKLEVNGRPPLCDATKLGDRRPLCTRQRQHRCEVAVRGDDHQVALPGVVQDLPIGGVDSSASPT